MVQAGSPFMSQARIPSRGRPLFYVSGQDPISWTSPLYVSSPDPLSWTFPFYVSGPDPIS